MAVKPKKIVELREFLEKKVKLYKNPKLLRATLCKYLRSFIIKDDNEITHF